MYKRQTWGYPVISVDYPASRCDVRFDSLPDQETLKKFVFDECKAEANWNMKNFIEDQVEPVSYTHLHFSKIICR